MSLSMLIAIKLKQGRKTEQIVYKQYENVMQCYQFKIGEENRANSIQKSIKMSLSMLIAINSKQGRKTEQIVLKQYEHVMQCYQFKIGEENRATSI